MYALLTMAARLESMLSDTTDVEASSYYGHCLELLIPALSRPESTYDDNILVTVIILRLYEELDSHTDPKFHLLGSNRLLNSISRFSSSGGLGEAASWQFLRQAIYVCLVQKEPWQLRLDHYEQSKVFERTDDASCANAMIYLFAKILRLISQPESQSIDSHEWHSLEARAERWKAQQPCSFEPLTYRGADVDAGQPFPEVWMLSPAAGMTKSNTFHVFPADHSYAQWLACSIITPQLFSLTSIDLWHPHYLHLKRPNYVELPRWVGSMLLSFHRFTLTPVRLRLFRALRI